VLDVAGYRAAQVVRSTVVQRRITIADLEAPCVPESGVEAGDVWIIHLAGSHGTNNVAPDETADVDHAMLKTRPRVQRSDAEWIFDRHPAALCSDNRRSSRGRHRTSWIRRILHHGSSALRNGDREMFQTTQLARGLRERRRLRGSVRVGALNIAWDRQPAERAGNQVSRITEEPP
jgi:hypothetical protein